MSVALVLEMASEATPDRVAVTCRGTDLTCAELFRRSSIAAARLRATGVRHLAHLGPNDVAFPVALFAASMAGVVLLPLNYRLAAEQTARLLQPHDEVLVIAEKHAADTLGDPATLADSAVTVVDRDEWLADTDDGELLADHAIDDDAIAVLLYTSGTTSAPKAAVLRHRHLLSYLFTGVEFGAAGPDDAALVTVPPYHIAGVANLLSNVYAGRRVVYLDGFTPEAWLTAIRDERVSHAMVVPTMLARIVQELGDHPPVKTPTLRSLAYGGSKIAPSIVERALRLFPDTAFVNAYGLTETSSTIAVLGPEDHRSALTDPRPDVRARLGSVGRPVPGVEARIRDEEGRGAPAGATGELWLRGPQVSGEYLGQGAAVDTEGWFPTRDRARFDDGGYLFVEGRMDDTIIRGGENIAPAEIEEVLLDHPDVAEAAVVGVPDEEWGQRIAAVVVPKESRFLDADGVREFTITRLRSSKTPDIIAVWPQLPYTTTGKLLRREVVIRLQE